VCTPTAVGMDRTGRIANGRRPINYLNGGSSKFGDYFRTDTERISLVEWRQLSRRAAQTGVFAVAAVV